MQILHTIASMRQACAQARSSGALGLVPTMGALHAGHLSLIRAAHAHCPVVAASIFVNPLQFAPGEDFERYPRTFDQDCTALETEGVALLFAPTALEMYPPAASTFVEVQGIGDRLDGAYRPGHFRGVATAVAKLFHIVTPDRAYFGQKDAAQVAVLRAMVRDLNFAVELIVCPTLRDPDGLALSSRNRFLSPAERQQALAIPQALAHIAAQASQALQTVANLRACLQQRLDSAPGLRLEYADLVHPATLEPLTDLGSGALVAVAAHVGATRLIDNVLLEPQQ